MYPENSCHGAVDDTNYYLPDETIASSFGINFILFFLALCYRKFDGKNINVMLSIYVLVRIALIAMFAFRVPVKTTLSLVANILEMSLVAVFSEELEDRLFLRTAVGWTAVLLVTGLYSDYVAEEPLFFSIGQFLMSALSQSGQLKMGEGVGGGVAYLSFQSINNVITYRERLENKKKNRRLASRGLARHKNIKVGKLQENKFLFEFDTSGQDQKTPKKSPRQPLVVKSNRQKRLERFLKNAHKNNKKQPSKGGLSKDGLSKDGLGFASRMLKSYSTIFFCQQSIDEGIGTSIASRSSSPSSIADSDGIEINKSTDDENKNTKYDFSYYDLPYLDHFHLKPDHDDYGVILTIRNVPEDDSIREIFRKLGKHQVQSTITGGLALYIIEYLLGIKDEFNLEEVNDIDVILTELELERFMHTRVSYKEQSYRDGNIERKRYDVSFDDLPPVEISVADVQPDYKTYYLPGGKADYILELVKQHSKNRPFTVKSCAVIYSEDIGDNYFQICLPSQATLTDIYNKSINFQVEKFEHVTAFRPEWPLLAVAMQCDGYELKRVQSDHEKQTLKNCFSKVGKLSPFAKMHYLNRYLMRYGARYLENLKQHKVGMSDISLLLFLIGKENIRASHIDDFIKTFDGLYKSCPDKNERMTFVCLFTAILVHPGSELTELDDSAITTIISKFGVCLEASEQYKSKGSFFIERLKFLNGIHNDMHNIIKYSCGRITSIDDELKPIANYDSLKIFVKENMCFSTPSRKFAY